MIFVNSRLIRQYNDFVASGHRIRTICRNFALVIIAVDRRWEIIASWIQFVTEKVDFMAEMNVSQIDFNINYTTFTSFYRSLQ